MLGLFLIGQDKASVKKEEFYRKLDSVIIIANNINLP